MSATGGPMVEQRESLIGMTNERALKVNYHGIEVDPEITWKIWRPGKKYIKKLMLKNVNGKTLRLNYSVPQKQVFATTYPKTITLSSGTTFALPITFQPDGREYYEDQMIFQTTEGNQFCIPVRALLPEYAVRMPDDIWCGVTAVHDQIKRVFTLENISELSTPFRWDSALPFVLEPMEGVLPPFGKTEISITFLPEHAETFEVKAVVAFGNNYQHSQHITVRALAKYPQVVAFAAGCSLLNHLNEEGNIVIDFGTTSVNIPTEKIITIQNPSDVGASVQMFRADETHPCDWVFSCPLQHSPVPPKSNLNIVMTFNPKIAWTKSVENFTIIVSNKCGTMNIVCVGESDGPDVTLSSYHFNFFQLEMGETATQPLEVINNSCSPTTFQFLVDPATSVFHFSCVDGVVPPHEKVRIVITFRPQKAIQYMRHVVCLVPDQDPMFLELMGTCHDLEHRPHILQRKHSQRFELRRQRGLSFFPPEELQYYLEKGTLSLDETGALMLKEAEELEHLCDPIKPLPAIKEYFYSQNDAEETFSVPPIAVDRCSIDFGGVKVIRTAVDAPETAPRDTDYRTNVSIVNNTRGPFLLDWTQVKIPGGGCPVFRVEPASCTIPAGKTVTAQVVFSPTSEGKIFTAELEGFAYFKAQRDYHITHEEVLAPPVCLLIKCMGHSFTGKANEEMFLPQCRLDRAEVIFPSVQPHSTAFRSLILTNFGGQPTEYHINSIDLPFAVKPMSGVLLPGRLQIFTLRCEPNAIARFSTQMAIHLNHRQDSILVASLLGSSDDPEIFLPNNGEIYFAPTNVGNCFQRGYSFKNISRIPLKYQWKIRELDKASLTVEPVSGSLMPNEFVPQRWTLYPPSKGPCVFKPQLMMVPILPGHAEHVPEPRFYPVRIIGCGETAALRMVEGYVDFGTVVIGSSSSKLLTLVNDWPCAVYYRLSIEEEVESSYPEREVSGDPCCLELDVMTGSLPGRCRQVIQVSLRPRRRASYRHRIEFQLLSNHPNTPGFNQHPIDIQKRHLCHVIGQGVFPTLRVSDVQGVGSAQTMSKKQLWTQFVLDNLNVCLDADPTSSEVLFTVATRQSCQRPAPVYTRAILDMNFGAAPFGSEPTEIQVLFENPGNVESGFHFLMPNQLQLELEYWAETGEFTADELHELKIQENHVYDIIPAKALLPPGGSQVVKFRYTHESVGTDRLPVLLKIAHGREIMLNFIGVTPSRDRPYLHFIKRKHTFTPIPIGEKEAPLQVYELYNGGSCPVNYHIDTTGLKRMREENFDYEILRCVNPEGCILPGNAALIQWRFSPLEARTYTIDVPIRINDGEEEAVVTFTGIGYDKRNMGETLPMTDGFLDCGAPSQQAIPLPWKLTVLSEERMSFGNVPLFSRTPRVVFLNNISYDKTVRFAWHVTKMEDSQVIQVIPPKGTLEPMKSCLCLVSFVAVGQPSFYDIDLVCEVFDEDGLRHYRNQLKQWHIQCKRMKEEFTITEHNLEEFQSESKTEMRSRAESKGSKYKTLPPIRETPPKLASIQTEKSSTLKTRKNPPLEPGFMASEPQPPKPSYLHLGITARSHTIEEFQTNFPQLWPTQFIDRTLLFAANATVPSKTPDATPLQSSKRSSEKLQERSSINTSAELCTEAEAHVVETTLYGLVRGLLDDTNFLDVLQHADSEPIPYFCQFPMGTHRGGIPKETDKNELPASKTEGEARKSQEPRASPAVSQQSRASPDPKPPGSRNSLVKSESPVSRHTPQQDEELPGTPSSTSSLPQGNETSNLPKRIGSSSPFTEAATWSQLETVKESPAFAVLAEGVLENILSNILAESNAQEFDLTARSRLIALPPRQARSARASAASNKPLAGATLP